MGNRVSIRFKKSGWLQRAASLVDFCFVPLIFRLRAQASVITQVLVFDIAQWRAMLSLQRCRTFIRLSLHFCIQFYSRRFIFQAYLIRFYCYCPCACIDSTSATENVIPGYGIKPQYDCRIIIIL
jgi:hypothetical protein